MGGNSLTILPTRVIFTSDNRANKTSCNFPFSGFKGNLFEGGIRVPCIARWAGVLRRGATSAQPCITMDFSRSIIAAAQAATPSDRPFDRIDIVRVVKENQTLQERTLFWRARRDRWTRKAVRHGSLKYIHLQNDAAVTESLFNLDAHPAEKNNILTVRIENLHTLRRLITEWEHKVQHKR